MQDLTCSKLDSLTLPIKALFTGYLLVIGLGLLMAGAQIMLTHGMADGKAGLSKDDVVYSYYGDRSGSKLETKLNGSMQDKAPHEANLTMIKWVREGAKESEWEPINTVCVYLIIQVTNHRFITSEQVPESRAFHQATKVKEINNECFSYLK